jgi:general L-amino acid transport system permease protein
VPIAVYAGFLAGWGCLQLARRFDSSLISSIAAAAGTLIWWFYLAGPVAGALGDALPLTLTPVASKQFGGFMLSIVIGMTGIAFSLPLGILLALGRRSDMLIVKSICVGFIEFIRGVPLITLLLVASFLLNIFLPPGTNFDIILRVIIMVTLFSAAYIAETIRGGLAALPRGQYEAADALGLDYWKSMRLIIMPQALKISIPGIVGNFISLFKDTTLVAIIALLDPVGLITSIRADTAWNGIVWELYGFVALIFFLCCYGMSVYSKYLERKLRTDHR